MSQEQKDALLFALPARMNNMLTDNVLAGVMLYSLDFAKNNVYPAYASEMIGLIKEHTEKVQTHNYNTALHNIIYAGFNSTERGCSRKGSWNMKRFCKRLPSCYSQTLKQKPNVPTKISQRVGANL